jgi:hypothetical protein
MKFVSMDMPIGDLLVGDDTPMPDQYEMIFGPAASDGTFTLSDTFLQRDILDRHIDSFFENVHSLFPILHEGAFRKLYGVFWEEVERRETCKDQILIGRDALDAGVMPLVCAVACHGALYSEDTDDQREWARGYFIRARRWLSVFESGSFETMIAMYFLVLLVLTPADSGHLRSACFQDKPLVSLLSELTLVAYNYLGLAIRLSFSIGLHIFNPATSDRTIATTACWPGLHAPEYSHF